MMIVWLTLTTLIAAATACPPKENLFPCTCFEDSELFPSASVYRLICSNIQNPNALSRPIAAFKRHHLLNMIIEYSSLPYIPSRTFKGYKYLSIKISNSNLQSLSDTDTAFEGLEDSLGTFRIESVKNASLWDYTQLRKLQALRYFSISFTHIGVLRHEIPVMKSLESIGFETDGITALHPTAFRNLKNVGLITLYGNQLKKLDRHMFPSAPNKLDNLILSENQISHLPHDFFMDMPLLKRLSLNKNQLQTLDQAAFQRIFPNLRSLYVNENLNFTCDCRLKWIGDWKYRMPDSFTGECYYPERLKGTPLKNLQIASFVC